jgi:hypothetical protein
MLEFESRILSRRKVYTRVRKEIWMSRLAGGVAGASQSMMVRSRTKLMADRHTACCSLRAAFGGPVPLPLPPALWREAAARHHVVGGETDKMESLS